MHRCHIAHGAVVAACLWNASCARDLDLDTPIDPTRVVVAQFDPSNPIPVLQLVPTPTALAEKADGTLNHAAVRPEDCERPTAAQCLMLQDATGNYAVKGWPTTTKPTLFFSTLKNENGDDTGKTFLETTDGAIDEANIKRGIKLWEKQPDGSLILVDYSFVVEARPAVNPACQDGDNGSSPAQTYLPEDVPGGIQIVLTPSRPLKPATEYAVSVESYGDDPAAGGVRDFNGHAIEPSALFYLLNTDKDEVADSGEISNPLLRSQVAGQAVAAYLAAIGKRSQADLTPAEQADLQTVLLAAGQSLRGLERFFDAATAKVLSLPSNPTDKISDRSHLIFANFWHTTATTEIVFDPLAGNVPFPNSQLLLRTSSTTPGLTLVNLPIPDDASPSTRATLAGLNTRTGFPTTAPIIMTATRDIRSTSLAGNVVMYPVGVDGLIDGPAVDITVSTSSGTAIAPPSIFVRPTRPLAQNKDYVVGVTTDVLDVDGRPISAASTFNALKLPTPFITAAGVNPAIVPLLECAPIAAGASTLATAEEVIQTAGLLEVGLNHQGFLQSFAALAAPPANIHPLKLAMAFGYRTQDIVTELDARIETDAEVSPPEIVPIPGYEIRTSTAIAHAFGLVENFCVGLCEAGAISGECTVEALSTNPGCLQIQALATGNLQSVRGYMMRARRLTAGSPYVSGTFRPDDAEPDYTYIPVLVFMGAGPSAGNPRPVTIFQHGIGRSKEDALLFANTLAAINRVTVAMDLPFHGDRATDILLATEDNPSGVPCGLVPSTDFIDPNDVQCAGGVCSNGCDGVPDPSGTGFLSPNLFANRDNFRQAVLDELTLIRTLEHEGSSDGALPALNGNSIAFMGQSLGGIVGASMAAYAPSSIETFVFNAAGGGLLDIIEHSVPELSAPLWAGLAASGGCTLVDAANPALGCQDTAAFRQFKQIATWVMEPGDPLANSIGVVTEAYPGRPAVGLRAGAVADPFPILMQVAWPDLVVSSTTAVELATAYGIEDKANLDIYDFSYLGDAATTGKGCHGWFLAPICGACTVDAMCKTFAAQIQAAQFMGSQGAAVVSHEDIPVLNLDCNNPCP